MGLQIANQTPTQQVALFLNYIPFNTEKGISATAKCANKLLDGASWSLLAFS